MNIIKYFGIGVVILVSTFVIVGLFLPSEVHVERATVIDASVTTVFTLLNGFPLYNEWSPWAEMDSEAVYTYEGPAFGTGARMLWVSDKQQVGSGTQEITSSIPYSEILTFLDFGEQGTADAFYRLTPMEDGIRVVWGFDTDLGNNLIVRYVGLGMDGMVGPDFEKGLANLKTFAESLPASDWSDLTIEIVETEAIKIAYSSRSTTHEHEEIGKAMASAYRDIGRYMKKNRLEKAGQPLAVNHEWTESYIFDAAIPITAMPKSEPGPDAKVRVGYTPSGQAIKAIHVGPYSEMAGTYTKIKAYAAASGLKLGETPWEQYISDPGDTPDEELVTHIYYPIG